MIEIRWDDSLLIGVEIIDSQHKDLISIINSVFQAVRNNEKEDKINSLLSWLREYTVHHFNSEEEYMAEIGYPKLGKHSQKHALLKKKVKEFQSARFHHEDISSNEIKGLLSEWLLNHILEEDMGIKLFLEESQKEVFEAD